MNVPRLPEIAINSFLKREIGEVSATFASVSDAEATALTSDIAGPLHANEYWKALSDHASSMIQECGYIVVRGLPADEGRSLLMMATSFGAAFDEYGPGRIVKRFRMSPWTNELSHTIRAGDFHTDGNVSPTPPIGTAIQCEREDPGAPEYGEQRVAFLPYLLERLASGNKEDALALAFLTQSVTSMAHERSPRFWRGILAQNGTIRYHPHSLRIASKRFDEYSASLEAIIATIHRAAIDISVPFHTGPGDTVLVSNQTALHFRGACSVQFTRFPTEFDARSVLVLHVKVPAQ